jgi:DNA-binding transcriptional ArsR family regulator
MSAADTETYWIDDRRQLEVMVSPRRHDIVDRLAASGPMSIRELAGQIGAQPSSLYHHVRKLMDVGLVIEAGSRVVRRRREAISAPPAPRMRVARAVAVNEYPELLTAIVAGTTRQLARDFRAGVGSAAAIGDGPGRNIGFLRMVARPSPGQLDRLNECLYEIAEILWASSDTASPAVTFGWVMAPLD